MVRTAITLGVLFLFGAASCSSSDESSPAAGGGGSAGIGGAAAAAGSSGVGGVSGTAGTAGSGGASGGAGLDAGGAGGASGAAGSGGASTGGSAGTGGSALTIKNYGTCPETAPAVGTSCTGKGICCYEPAGVVLFCQPSLVFDGGSGAKWASMPNASCCPASPPSLGSACDVPGVTVCCYGTQGFSCGSQQEPNKWLAASGC
ncbi:MAG: hypothetical protein R3B13_12830 [Polyangiaceae bacterium]